MGTIVRCPLPRRRGAITENGEVEKLSGATLSTPATGDGREDEARRADDVHQV